MNKTTSPENSQGVLFYERAPASSSDFNEFQTVINNRFQALAEDIRVSYSINGLSLTLNSINIKNKVVAQMEGVSITLPATVCQLYIYTRSQLVNSPQVSVYLYGLRSNPQFEIIGADTPGANNIIPDALDIQVSDRNLTEWTCVALSNGSPVPTLQGWNYEGTLSVSSGLVSGFGSSSISSLTPKFVDYVVTGSTFISNLNGSQIFGSAWSGQGTVLNLADNTDFNIYKWSTDTNSWSIVDSLVSPETIVFAADTLDSSSIPNTTRKTSGVYIYLLDNTLTYRITQFGGGVSSSSEFDNSFILGSNNGSDLPSSAHDLFLLGDNLMEHITPPVGSRYGAVDNNLVIGRNSFSYQFDTSSSSNSSFYYNTIIGLNSLRKVYSATYNLALGYITSPEGSVLTNCTIMAPTFALPSSESNISNLIMIGGGATNSNKIASSIYIGNRSTNGLYGTHYNLLSKSVIIGNCALKGAGANSNNSGGALQSVLIGHTVANNNINQNSEDDPSDSYRNTAPVTHQNSVIIGYSAFTNNYQSSTSTPSGNVYIGSKAGAGNVGSSNVVVGYQAESEVAGSEGVTDRQNVIVLGSNAISSANNQITLGNSMITQLRCQVTSISSLSDPRVKEEIELADTSRCLDSVLNLPVSRYKYRDFTGTHLDTHVTGWLSTDYKKVFPKGVQATNESYPVLDESGSQVYEEIDGAQVPKRFTIEDVESITPTEALPTLWGAVQELKKIIDQQQSEINELKSLLNK